MSVDTQKIIEIVKQVKPLFLDREGSSQIKVMIMARKKGAMLPM